MAERTSGQVSVAATIDRVVEVVTDIEQYPLWATGMSNIVVHERDQLMRPLVVSIDVAAGPIKETVTLRYHHEAAALSWTLVEGKQVTAMNGRYSWQAEPTGAHISYELELELSVPMPGMIRRIAEQTIITTALQGLKRQVEAG